jgi:hypothetical protein
VNIVSTVPYDPEPDVAVIREDENPDPRYADRFYLVAEVLSESDKGIIESKRDIYRAHPSCACILLVRQDRVVIMMDRRLVFAGPAGRRRALAARVRADLSGPGRVPRHAVGLSLHVRRHCHRTRCQCLQSASVIELSSHQSRKACSVAFSLNSYH